MGMALGAGSGKGRRRSVADINVTPMVDVMLVLLVIFMITAPTLKEGFSVNMAQADATNSINMEDARTIVVTEDGFVLKADASSREEHYDKLTGLVDDLKAYKEDVTKNQKKPVVVIVGDKDAKYQRIIQVWNAVRNAGIAEVSFQVEPGNSDAPNTPAVKDPAASPKN